MSLNATVETGQRSRCRPDHEETVNGRDCPPHCRQSPSPFFADRRARCRAASEISVVRAAEAKIRSVQRNRIRTVLLVGGALRNGAAACAPHSGRLPTVLCHRADENCKSCSKQLIRQCTACVPAPSVSRNPQLSPISLASLRPTNTTSPGQRGILPSQHSPDWSTRAHRPAAGQQRAPPHTPRSTPG